MTTCLNTQLKWFPRTKENWKEQSFQCKKSFQVQFLVKSKDSSTPQQIKHMAAWKVLAESWLRLSPQTSYKVGSAAGFSWAFKVHPPQPHPSHSTPTPRLLITPSQRLARGKGEGLSKNTGRPFKGSWWLQGWFFFWVCHFSTFSRNDLFCLVFQ